MYFPSHNIVKFVLGPTLQPSPPRFKPPRLPHYGDYCFRAVCFLHPGPLETPPKGKITGYDRSVTIAEEVENACKLHASKVPGVTCGPPQLTMLPSSPRECGGELYFVFGDV